MIPKHVNPTHFDPLTFPPASTAKFLTYFLKCLHIYSTDLPKKWSTLSPWEWIIITLVIYLTTTFPWRRHPLSHCHWLNPLPAGEKENVMQIRQFSPQVEPRRAVSRAPDSTWSFIFHRQVQFKWYKYIYRIYNPLSSFARTALISALTKYQKDTSGMHINEDERAINMSKKDSKDLKGNISIKALICNFYVQ